MTARDCWGVGALVLLVLSVFYAFLMLLPLFPVPSGNLRRASRVVVYIGIVIAFCACVTLFKCFYAAWRYGLL